MYISQFNPWKFLNSSRKALGRSQSRGRGFDRRFRQDGLPAARATVGKSMRGLGRTCRCAWLDGRWPEEAGPLRRMAGGGSTPWRRLSDGEGVEWPGLGAARERGGARGGVYAGGVAVEERGDGELELAGVRAGGGGVLEIWSGEVVRE